MIATTSQSPWAGAQKNPALSLLFHTSAPFAIKVTEVSVLFAIEAEPFARETVSHQSAAKADAAEQARAKQNPFVQRFTVNISQFFELGVVSFLGFDRASLLTRLRIPYR